ncbi:MAG: SpoIID/LytB domain-containing protein, partial [Lachnospirales bacterium]
KDIDFVYSEGKILGGIIKNKEDFSKVRVLLNNSGFFSYFFNEVSFSGMLTVNGVSCETTTVKSEDLELYDLITITSEEGIYFDSITRSVSGGIPIYEGSIEVIKVDNGLVAINVLPLESYLKKVVPSEMPSTYNIEALKSQAVSARTYAIKQIKNQIYQKYGAMIDDSTSSQVYNNIDTQESTNKAVDETLGEVLVFDNEVISTNFFSTSSGFTTNSGDVWGNSATLAFPTETPEYLEGKSLLTEKINIDFNNEEDVLNFYKNKKVKAIDDNVSWFRWETSLSFVDIENNINSFVKDRMDIVPYLFESDFDFNSGTFTGIKSIEVLSRGTNGVVHSILIKNDTNYLKVHSEYNIRKILAPINNTLTCADGSTLDKYTILPSGFFAFESNESSIFIYGGGNGHGVGLSQNAANTLGNQGKSYVEILNTFYTNATIKIINDIK